MLRRTRTTKKLARRIDLRSRASASVSPLAFLAVCGGSGHRPGVVGHAAGAGRTESVLERAARRIARGFHTAVQSLPPRPRGKFQRRRRATRLAWHAMTHPRTMLTRLSRPSCSSCHLEHKGARLLAATSDSSCSQCHADLQTRDGRPHYEASIAAFAKGHPEFSALRAGKADPGRVKFNHYVHLQPHLMGPNDMRVELSCDDCHRTANGNDGWPYAATLDASQVSESVPQGLKPASLAASDGTAEAVPFPIRERYMAPIRFSQNCAACHTLQFDKRFGNEQVPHEKPEVVHAFLLKRFGEYIAAHPQAVHAGQPA